MSKPKYLGKLISVDEAVKLVLEKARLELLTKLVDIYSALNHVLAEDIYALYDAPAYDRSAVDGYAVRSIDTIGASPLNPAILRVKGSISPGDDPRKYSVGENEAVEITTGAPLPPGADAVVMYEDTHRINDFVEIYKAVPMYANVSRKGEDYKKNELLVKSNTLLTDRFLAIIASTGIRKIRVYEKIRIGLITTGNELVEPGHELRPGKIYNSTSILVKTYLEKHAPFTVVKYYGIYPDNYNILVEVLSKALSENHIVITTGGTGVSGEDVIRDVIEDNGKWIFRGVALRPGRPTSSALVNDKLVFMLSGFPVAAWAALESIVLRTIYLLHGLNPPFRCSVKARLIRRVPNTIGYRTYIRVSIRKDKDKGLIAEPYMLKGSGILSSLTKSNGYIVLRENVEGYEEDSIVDAYLL